jgi:hypothetical protein
VAQVIEGNRRAHRVHPARDDGRRLLHATS